MSTAVELPGENGKMPANYDFSTKGFNWAEYRNDFLLRTDAVWEKYQMKDWFRLYMKCFYFDTIRGHYRIMEPEDFYTMTMEPWCIPSAMIKFKGHNITGRTTCFQTGLPPRQQVEVSHTIYQSQQDYWTLCALRFDKWMDCDLPYSLKTADNPELYIKNYRNYPCYNLYHEANAACQDDAFAFLLEIHYYRKTNNIYRWMFQNHEMQKAPTIFDSPENAERIKKTY